ncbi:MAG: hypothetical protein mread185_000180 [Mycoplasmataceae bacterium]|nr:MAG: hypothetical protein mread185_000180 [Mycoplasmataceae bacterium]
MLGWIKGLINYPPLGINSAVEIKKYFWDNWGKILILLLFVVIILWIIRSIINFFRYLFY